MYRKGGAAPAVAVIANAGTENERILQRNVDYTLSYSNTKYLRNASSKNPPKVTIKGKGNFSGKRVQTFTIVRSDLKQMLKKGGSVSIANAKYSTKKNGWMSKPVLRDSNGKKLSNADYKVRYYYLYPVVADGHLIPERTEVGATDPVPIATRIYAEISGQGNYDGQLEDPEKYAITYRIVK